MTTGKITHYLVTRFNVRMDGFGPEYFDPSSRTLTWENERIPLFEHYCAPSVNAQSQKDFTWLLFCDLETPLAITERIKRAIDPSVRYQLIFTTGFGDMLIQLRQLCAHAPALYVITTRLDNDDGISVTFMETVRDHFIEQDKTILNPLGGMHYHVTKGILTWHRYSLRNSFMSLIEVKKEPENMRTVLGFRHLVPDPDMHIINIPAPYLFWMTLHPHNAALRRNLGWPVPVRAIPAQYGIDPAWVRIHFGKTMLYILQWLPVALIRKLGYISKTQMSSMQRRFFSKKNLTDLT